MTLQRYSHAREMFWQAVKMLVGNGSLKDRLEQAWKQLYTLNPQNELPEHLQARFQALMKDLNKSAVYPPILPGVGHLPARIKTKAPKSVRMAEEILSLYIALRGGI